MAYSDQYSSLVINLLLTLVSLVKMFTGKKRGPMKVGLSVCILSLFLRLPGGARRWYEPLDSLLYNFEFNLEARAVNRYNFRIAASPVYLSWKGDQL